MLAHTYSTNAFLPPTKQRQCRWLAAASIALFIHGAVLTAYYYTPHKVDVKPIEAAPAVFQIAQILQAPSTEQQATEQSAAQPPPPETQPQAVSTPHIDIDKAPVVEKSTLTVKPDTVADTKDNHVETPDSPLDERKTPEQTNTVLEQPTPTTERESPQQMTPQPPSVAQVAKQASSSAAPVSGYSDTALLSLKTTWLNEVMIELAHEKRYPRLARKKQQEGVVIVRFKLSQVGAVDQVEIIKSAGVKRLDDEAVALIHRASPLPQAPETVFAREAKNGAVEMVIPIEFYL